MDRKHADDSSAITRIAFAEFVNFHFFDNSFVHYLGALQPDTRR